MPAPSNVAAMGNNEVLPPVSGKGASDAAAAAVVVGATVVVVGAAAVVVGAAVVVVGAAAVVVGAAVVVVGAGCVVVVVVALHATRVYSPRTDIATEDSEPTTVA